MSTFDETVNVGFDVDLTALATGMQRAKAEMIKVQKQINRSAKDMATSMQEVTEEIDGIKAMAGAMGLAVVVSASKAAVEMARFADSARSVEQYFYNSFGVMGDEAKAWASDLADAYGVYDTEVYRFMADLNEGFLRAGNSMSESLRMAEDFTQISYDLSKFYPQYDTEQIQDWLKDLAVGGGEEALEKLASGFDEAALQAKAMELGLASASGELTVLAKQQAAYALIMEEHGDKMGLYGESADSATASLNRLQAESNELRESLGELFGPAVTYAAEKFSGIIDEITEKIDDLTTTINSISGTLGFGEVFKKEVEKATSSTNTLDEALATLNKDAEDLQSTLLGLAGFDKLFVLNPQSTLQGPTESANWEGAFKEWSDLFLTDPEGAATYMDPLWDTILEGGVQSADQLRDKYGDYFDWMLDTEMSTADLSAEEKAARMDQFYQEMENALVLHEQSKLKIEQEYIDRVNEFNLGQSQYTLDEIESMREVALEETDKALRLSFSTLTADLLADFGIITEEIALKMQLTFQGLIDEIKKTVGQATEEILPIVDTVDSAIQEFIRDLQTAITLSNKLDSKQSKPTSLWENLKAEWNDPEGNNFWANQKDIEVDYLRSKSTVKGYANGGVFAPNNPQIIGIGDNTREREVVAPESMIEQAVLRALAINGQGANSQDKDIRVTIELDGRVLAEQMYKYNQQVALRRGNTTRF